MDKAYENTSLLRTQADSSTTQPAEQNEESIHGDKQGSHLVTGTGSSFHRSRVVADSPTVISAETGISRSGNTPIPLKTSENVLYDDIKGFKKEQVSTIHFFSQDNSLS